MRNNKIDLLNFSVICCCYNSEKYILETLLSIKNQSYKNYEIIIVNDGSKDNTSNIINIFIKKNKDVKIKFIEQENKGLAESRNTAIKNSSYPWISIIDHDDLWEINKLEEQVKDIKNNEDSRLFFSDFKYLNNLEYPNTRFNTAIKKDNYDPYKINMKKKSGFINLSIYGCFIGSSTVTFKKDIFLELGGFEKKYIFITDYIFFLNVSKKYNIFCSNKVLSQWREHDLQSTKLINHTYVNEMNRLYLKLYFDKNLLIFHKIRILKNQLRLNIINILKFLKIK